MTDRWTLNALAAPAVRHWDEETVVHHRLSNDTHRLAEPAGFILDRLLGSGPLAPAEIAAGSPYGVAQLAPALSLLSELNLLVRC